MEGIVFIALFIGAIVLLQKAKAAAGRQVNQKVLFRSDHEKGQATVHTRLEFSAPDATAHQVINAVLAHSNLPSTPESIVGRSWVKQKNEHQVLIAIGSKLTTSTHLLLNVENDSDGHGSTGAFAVANWTESDGLILGYEEMDRLKGVVRSAITNLDPNATFQDVRVT